VIKYTQNVGGSVQRFDGTLGPYASPRRPARRSGRATGRPRSRRSTSPSRPRSTTVSGAMRRSEDVGGTRATASAALPTPVSRRPIVTA
jgi:hypothetical protein